jgi:hypothetical protein
MSDNSFQNLSAQIFAMQAKHRQLDAEIERMQDQPFVDQLELQRLKKRKLRLKETIEMLKDQLIPDIDA